ncbi:MAG: nucleoside-diphosphate kinase [candidate division Zixibacteria bacterium]|nr:nucleoside-diphosphate kinase [Candidatus Tariuqbacter arcticus]
MERTLLIIKPDAVSAGRIGNILTRIIDEGFQIRAMRMLKLEDRQAREFYDVHEGKKFYQRLVEFMTSGRVVVCALFRENAVEHLREVIGTTNSPEAEPGTIRRMYGANIEKNAVHGSDSVANGQVETDFFFDPFEYTP